MVRVGLVGEDPNDTKSIRHLLEPAFAGRAQFFPMLKNIRGNALDTQKFTNELRVELRDHHYDVVVFIRDADGIRTEEQKLQKRREWYAMHAAMVQRKPVLLLNIYELEALILADIETFKSLYHVDIKYTGDVAMQEKPADWLRSKTARQKKFEKSDCPNVFKVLNLDTVRQRCNYFEAFYQELNAIVGK